MAQLFIPKTAIFKEGGGEPIVEGSVYAYMPTQEPQYSLFILVGKNSGQIPDIPGGGTRMYIISGYLLPLKSPNLRP